ncbi:MAG: HlyC/CorC family transporter, partial [Bdellovibrionales bacterium]
MLWLILGTVFLLLMLSAFFSGSETAFTAVSSTRLRAAEKDGDERAGLVLDILQRKERMIGALLLGNNLVNILASALATSAFIGLVGEAGVVYATGIMTLLVLIFAEVLPKTYALHHSQTMTRFVAPVISILIKVLSPITETVTAIVRRTLRLFGADISKVTGGSHLDLLKGVIDQHQGADQETQTQRAMLRSVLDLADVDVEEIMIHRRNVEMIDIDLPIEKIVESALSSQYTRLPLYRDDQDNIVGVLHAKELLRALQKVGGDASALDIEDVALEPWFIPETTTLFDQLQTFKQRREHFAY